MKHQGDDLASFPKQIDFALRKYEDHGLKADHFNKIVICGLGGSGIAGRLVQAFVKNKVALPVTVVSEYKLPAYVDDRSLVIASSYSGNTEETLSMLEDAQKRDSKILVLSTGGKIGEIALDKKYTWYKAEAGYQPRMALGYSLTYLFLIFGELFGINFRQKLEKARQEFVSSEPFIKEAEALVDKFGDFRNKKFVFLADENTAAIALRCCQQLQENAKLEAFVNEIPESNHNVIETYYGKLPTIFFAFKSNENERNQLRFKFTTELLRKEQNVVFEESLDSESLEEQLKLIFKFDWISLLLADRQEINSADIRNIKALKAHLSEN